MDKLIIDGEGIVMGRLASYTAKKALEGYEISVINSEKVIISGDKVNITEKYLRLRRMGGNSLKGPRIQKNTERILKRAIRGMLPDHRVGRGREAWKRIKCYNGVPKEFENGKITKLQKKQINEKINLKELKQRL